jgi:hypothetical protein
MELPRTARKPVEVDVVATLPNGSPATVTGVRFAFCDHGGPTSATAWTDGSYNAPTGGIVLAGRDAASTGGALVLTVARAELWGLPVTGSTTVDPWYIETVETP